MARSMVAFTVLAVFIASTVVAATSPSNNIVENAIQLQDLIGYVLAALAPPLSSLPSEGIHLKTAFHSVSRLNYPY